MSARAYRPLPSAERLRQLLDYDPTTGNLRWRHRGDPHFDGQFAGRPAFTYRNSNGYRAGRIEDRPYLAHRIIWRLVHGTEPNEIDHIDGDPSNNRIENLRSVSHAENTKNTARGVSNTTGVVGVVFVPRVKGFRAYVTVGRRQRHLGYFKTLSEAEAVRVAAEEQAGFHENHGRGKMPASAGRVRSEAVRQSARGQSCALRIPFVCCGDDETVVLAHLPGHSRGVGLKGSDIHAAYACFACHNAIDGRAKLPQGVTPAIILDAMLRGLSETQALLVQAGLITITED